MDSPVPKELAPVYVDAVGYFPHLAAEHPKKHVPFGYQVSERGSRDSPQLAEIHMVYEVPDDTRLPHGEPPRGVLRGVVRLACDRAARWPRDRDSRLHWHTHPGTQVLHTKLLPRTGENLLAFLGSLSLALLEPGQRNGLKLDPVRLWGSALGAGGRGGCGAMVWGMTGTWGHPSPPGEDVIDRGVTG